MYYAVAESVNVYVLCSCVAQSEPILCPVFLSSCFVKLFVILCLICSRECLGKRPVGIHNP